MYVDDRSVRDSRYGIKPRRTQLSIMNKVTPFQERDIMKNGYVSALLTLTCLLGLGIGVHAQDIDAVVISIPFEFVVGGATLPAGQYRVSRTNPGTNRELSISGYNHGGAFLLPLSYEGVSSDEPKVSFEYVGGQYLLSKIKTLNGVYTMPTQSKQIMLGQTTAPSTVAPSGTR
jgi:hypothetical protein